MIFFMGRTDSFALFGAQLLLVKLRKKGNILLLA